MSPLTDLAPLGLITLLLVVVPSGCGTRPEMTEFTRNYVQDEKDCPVILVGVVLEGSAAGKPHSARYNSQELVQRFRVKVKVETILQGEVLGTEVNIYFFSANMSFTGSGIPYSFAKGDRDVFFLQQDYGELRTITDTVSNRSIIRVFSGAHPDFHRNPATPIWDSLVDLTLTRGIGTDDKSMAEALQKSWMFKEHSEPELIKKWTELASNETGTVREAACTNLKSMNCPCPAH